METFDNDKSRLKTKKKMKTGTKIALTILSIFLVLFVGVAGYAYWAYSHTKNTVNDKMYQPLERKVTEERPKQVDIADKAEAFSVLVLGVDKREGDSGRSDSMMVLTVNKEKNSVIMTSIPRDTRTEIVGRGTQDKINHAYAFGGVDMSVVTVEKMLNIPIDYYVQVNMQGFRDIIDAIGGVTVTNNLDFKFGGYTFNKGVIHLNGDEALAYSRMRKQDPNGDFGRQERQRQVIDGVIKEGANLSLLTKYDDIINALGSNVKTNLLFNDMLKIQKNYFGAQNNVTQQQLKGSGTKINGIYYYVVPDAERLNTSNMLREHLDLTKQ